ncbi:right-handed parallel beta-helix repeat-containing protein [Methanolapillus ohkumae]|uniref:Right handed beta helix domain-containing protein n=1 Tax=Methanolapillus ohkumae TaxID=3028298 RepID=A0AA96V4Z2_9EURY|nr:hypothetical protein MsAm2_03510 [Methanosarcinaceae archaeon Am2]
MTKRRMTTIFLLLLLTFIALLGTAVAFSGTGTSGDPYVVEVSDTDLSSWTQMDGDFIRVENFILLDEVLNASAVNTTILLVSGNYLANQYVINTQDGLTVTNADSMALPIIQLTAATDGFKIQRNNTTIKNVTLDGTNVANYGFRIQHTVNTTFDNVTAINMVKTAFDISRNTDSSFTNLTARNNGGFGITITQGSNVTVSGTTENNTWGGLNINNKEFGDADNIGITAINVSGIIPMEGLPVIVEEYNTTLPNLVRSNLTGPTGVDIPSESIIVSNMDPTGIDSSTPPIFAKLYLLNQSNSADQNGQILSDILNESLDGNEIDLPPGTYNVGNVTVSSNVTLVGTGNPTIVGTLTPGEGVIITEEGVTVTPTQSSGSSGGGFGQATVLDTAPTNTSNMTPANNTTNNTVPPTNMSNTTNNTSNTNNTSTPSGSESWWDQYWWIIAVGAVVIIAAAGGYYYYYVYKPKNP